MNEHDLHALECLQGLKSVQQEIRQGWGSVSSAAQYAAGLPQEVAKRLTEIDIPVLVSGEYGQTMAAQLASDAAIAQVIRAANAYRAMCGYAPLGPDGWPVEEEV